jgi:hypothetical protein
MKGSAYPTWKRPYVISLIVHIKGTRAAGILGLGEIIRLRYIDCWSKASFLAQRLHRIRICRRDIYFVMMPLATVARKLELSALSMDSIPDGPWCARSTVNELL